MRDITCFALHYFDIYHAHDIKNHSRTSNLYRTHTFPFLRSYIIEDGVARNFSFRVTRSLPAAGYTSFYACFVFIRMCESLYALVLRSYLTFPFISSWLIFHGTIEKLPLSLAKETF